MVDLFSCKNREDSDFKTVLFVVFDTVQELDKLQKNEVSSTSLGLLSPISGEESSAELLRERVKISLNILVSNAETLLLGKNNSRLISNSLQLISIWFIPPFYVDDEEFQKFSAPLISWNSSSNVQHLFFVFIQSCLVV